MTPWWRRWRSRRPSSLESWTHAIPVEMILRWSQTPGMRHLLIHATEGGARLTVAASPLARDAAVLACLRRDLRPDEWPPGPGAR